MIKGVILLKLMKEKNVVIFGGSGFIGTHLTRFLLQHRLASKIYCIDLQEPSVDGKKIVFIRHDLRKPFVQEIQFVETIYNLAAVHTTPGHADEEYYETNILAAQHVCDFARIVAINTIAFTSSISPYGTSEEFKEEDSIPQPTSAYGSSKIVAEYIHRCWLAESNQRRLAILRPGVVYGQGEGGNFTRLYDGLKGRYFFYPGRKDTRKACIYVKDLVRAIYDMTQDGERFKLFNMCYAEAPTIEEIVEAFVKVTRVPRPLLVIPGGLMTALTRVVLLIVGNSATRSAGIHPDRVRKLMISTNIGGKKLAESPYAPRYTLQEAIADWYQSCNGQGLF